MSSIRAVYGKGTKNKFNGSPELGHVDDGFGGSGFWEEKKMMILHPRSQGFKIPISPFEAGLLDMLRSWTSNKLDDMSPAMAIFDQWDVKQIGKATSVRTDDESCLVEEIELILDGQG